MGDTLKKKHALQNEKQLALGLRPPKLNLSLDHTQGQLQINFRLKEKLRFGLQPICEDETS